MTDLIIGFDYQKIIKQFRNLRKAKDFLASVNTGPFEPGRIGFDFRYSPLDEGIEQVNFTLRDEGPFYLLDWRTFWNLAKCRAGEWPHWGHLKWSKEYRKAKDER
jgi:hypothetical protein